MTNLLSLITPTNLNQEREKFFSSSTYNPTFHYIWQDRDVHPSFSTPLKQDIWNAVKIQNHAGIVIAASTYFEVQIDRATMDQALQVSGQAGDQSDGSLEQILAEFEAAFKYFDLDYKLKVEIGGGFNIRPDHGRKQLIISDQIHFEYFSLQAEARHELVHILRQCNGEHNQIKRSLNFLPTEEGLASWCQDHTNNDLSQVQHAMEYVATAAGIDGSLRDIYDSFCAMGSSKELAWKRASRHKFGFVDTSKPGDIMKPAMYFANELKIDKLTTQEKLRLFVGKIALSDLPDYPTYTGLWSAEKLINYFKL